MRIGELSRLTQTPIDTIRFYERIGLLPPPGRTTSNYRAYQPSHVARLLFVRRCRSLDMPLGDVRRLISFCDAPERHCTQVNELLDAHIARVQQRVAALEALEAELRELRAVCRKPGGARRCAILRTLRSSPQHG